VHSFIRHYLAARTLALPVLFAFFGSQSGALAAVPPFHAAQESMPASRSLQETTAKPLIFVSNGADRVHIFLQGGKNKLVGLITGLSAPAGLTNDAAGNLYVTNSVAQTALAYAPPYDAAPYLTLSPLGDFLPVRIAVSRKGVVAVVIACLDGSCSPDIFVSLFAKGSTTACAMIPLIDIASLTPPSLAFDHAGNIFLTGQLGSNTYMSEISGGCNATTVTPLTAGNISTLGPLSAVHVNRNNQVAILTEHGSLYTYNQPKNGSLGNPVYTTGGLAGAVDFAFTASGRDMYAVMDPASNPSSVEEINYPSGTVVKTFTLPSKGHNISVTPALIP
jgi:hypothetical protein